MPALRALVRSRILAAGLALVLSAPLHGQEGAEVGSWTADDLLLEESAGDFAISPGGRLGAWVRSAVDPEEGRTRSHLRVTRIADGESWALTRGPGSDRSPRWSPDGRILAFLSSRDVPGEEETGGRQIWALRLDGGEPWPVTRSARGLRSFAWKGEGGDTLVYLAQEAPPRFREERRERDDDAVAVEDTLQAPPRRLWSVAAEGGEASRLTTNRDWIEAFALSPDGSRAVTRTGVDLSYTFDAENPPMTHLVDLATGERRELDLGRRVVPSGMAWSPDGDGFFYAYEHSSDPFFRTASVTRMGFYDIVEDRDEEVDLGWERGLGQGFRVVPGGFVALLADGLRDRPARFAPSGDGWERRMLTGEHASNIWGWTVSEDGEWFAYATSAADVPEQPYVARLDGSALREPRRLATLNPGHAGKPKPRVEIIRWEGARADEVEGILYYPLGYTAGERRPLVVNIHGGPAGRDADRWDQGWSSPLLLWSQRGAFVLQVNYHGSCCYGLEWVESIAGGEEYYTLPVADIESGVDRLVEDGLVHPDSIVTQGWSNGAILSTRLTVDHPERYRASLAGAGDVEWISDWGNVDFGASFDDYYFGASPLEDPERYIELSPFFRLDEVRAPTLVFFGTEDRNVPPSQGWSHFRALQQIGETEVRFVLFPGEPHGLRELAHRRRKVEEEVRWLDRHLWGEAGPGDELAVEPGSPLHGALARAGAARTPRGHYGSSRDGILVPETVRREGLEVGRFEVTRAQWASFDAGYRYPPGTGNVPVTGVAFADARAYVEWLSERTGASYRLPGEAEARELAGTASGGVTLDWWAGYAPNPRDRERLARLAERLSGDAPLLREVGSFPGDAPRAEPPGRAPEPVFDLGGNAAEWAVVDDGAGVPVGPSADRPRGEAGKAGPAAPPYRGLRVVKGGSGGP